MIVLFFLKEVVQVWWSSAVDGPISSVRILHHSSSNLNLFLLVDIIPDTVPESTDAGSYHLVVGSALELGVVFL